MTEERPSHLRLVTTSSTASGGARGSSLEKPKLIPRKARQLQLPHLDSLTFVLASVQSFHGLGEFSEYVGELKPKWVFDIRTIPRLDVLGGTRSHVFSVFQRQDIAYVDLFGVLGIHSELNSEAKPSIWSQKLIQLMGAPGRSGGIALLLFDNLELLRSAALALPGYVESVVKRPIAIATRV